MNYGYDAGRAAGLGIGDSLNLAVQATLVDVGTQATNASNTNIHAMAGQLPDGSYQTPEQAFNGAAAVVDSNGASPGYIDPFAIHTIEDSYSGSHNYQPDRDPLLGFKPSHFGPDSDYHYDAIDAVTQYIMIGAQIGTAISDAISSRSLEGSRDVRRRTSEVMGEIEAIVILWGLPTLLAFAAWWRYRQIQTNCRPSLLRIGMLSLMVSEVMLLLIGAAVALESMSTARLPFMLQTVGFINFFLCAVALLTSLTAKTSDTARIWIIAASAYLMFVWLYAMLAH